MRYAKWRFLIGFLCKVPLLHKSRVARMTNSLVPRRDTSLGNVAVLQVISRVGVHRANCSYMIPQDHHAKLKSPTEDYSAKEINIIEAVQRVESRVSKAHRGDRRTEGG